MKMLLFQESEFSLLVAWEEEFVCLLLASTDSWFCLSCVCRIELLTDFHFYIYYSFCSSIIPSVFAVVAFFLAWMGTLGCRFIQFDLTTNNNSTTTSSTITSQDFITVHFGIWYRQSVELYNYTASGNGYYQVSTCTDYNNDNINVDPSWMAARAFSTMVLILGGTSLFIALVICCCVGNNNNSSSCVPSNIDLMNGILYLLISLLQGLTLIILSSQLCQNNGDITKMMENGDVINNGSNDNNLPEKCNLSQGAKCIISATVLWFFAGIMSLISYKGERMKLLEAKKNSLLVMDAAYSAAPLLP